MTDEDNAKTKDYYTAEERFQGLCHQVLNLISVLKGLALALERHNLDTQSIIGQMAHRCGEAEAAVKRIMNNSLIEEEGEKEDG